MAKIDLDALRAEAHAKAGEDELEPHEIEFGGETHTFPRTEEWPAAALELITEQGRFSAAFRWVMGEDAFARFAAHEPRLGDYRRLFDALQAAEGVGDAGNSSGSSRSSRSTPRRSKRTSPATTG